MGKPLCHIFLFCILMSPVVNKLLAQDTIQVRRDSMQHEAGTVSLIYFQSPRRLTTTATSVVYGKDMMSTPVASYPLALNGRVPGLVINQSSGQPLNEDFSINLRGQSPLVIIDGIPRALTEIGMQEIESVTLLKDAVSTAMLGVRGSKGALLVTTKKGFVGRQVINASIQTGISKPIDNLLSAPLNVYNYAQLYNEALTNDGLPIAGYGFSQAALDAYRTGADPLKYPDVNWRNEVQKNSAFMARYNVNASGGNQFVKYFVSLEHFKQNGFLRTSSLNKYNTNSDFAGYFARSNADLKLTDNLSAGIYIQGRIMNNNNPGNNATESLFTSLLNTPAGSYPIYNANGSYAGSNQFQNNIVARSIGSGYSQTNIRTILSDFYVKGKLDNLVPGLWMKGRASFFSNLSEQITRNKAFAVYEQTGTSSSGSGIYKQYNTNTSQVNTNSINFQNRSDFQEVSLGHAAKFGGHSTDVVVLANRDNLVNGSNLPYTIQGISGHGAYNFKEKYLLDVSFAVNGNNRYYDNGDFKYGFFPAVGLGWNIAKEDFMSGIKWLNTLKLYGSYGKLGLDNAYYYTFQQVYNASPAAYFGSSAGQATTIGESYLANPFTTWEKSKKLNVGVQASLLKDLLSFQVEYYNDHYYDLSIVRGNNNSILGISYPTENIGKEKYSGIETQFAIQQQKKNWGYHLMFNAAFQRSTSVYSAEPAMQYDWMQRTGQPVRQRFGYVAEGLFQNQQEINGHATVEGYTPQPGDIRYKDLNSDGIINQYDQTAIGNKNPVILLGSSIGFNFHGFDFSMLLQGSANRQVYLSDNSYWEFQNSGTGQAYEHHQNRWTPANAANATYPRLTTGMGPANGKINNWVTSSYWLRSGNYLRAKTLEIGYAVPTRYTKHIGLQTARIYINAYNFFMVSSATLDGVDPENYMGNYPIQKTVSAGINIQL